MTERTCIHCIVSGRVQGVWFRATTQDVARSLGLNGWVRNLPDNQVELIACGPKAKVEEFEKWLWQGPQLAKVANVDTNQVEWQEFDGFEVR